MAETVFWIAMGVVVYVYVIYPLVVTAVARLRPRPARSDARFEPTVSFVIAAYNEEPVIAAKIENTLALDYPAEKLEVLVASDGSDDRTEEIARRYQGPRMRVVALRPRGGKALALERGVPKTSGDIVVLTDANTILRRDALRKLVRHFADPVVGVVTGDVRLIDPKKGYADAEGAYYRYERHLQSCESTASSVVGVDGGMYALRRPLFRAPERDTILDDFVISMEVAKRGYRIVYDPEAVAEEDAAPDVDQEFRRKVRVLAGAWQCMKRGAGVPAPRTPALFATFVSHKLLRWSVPLFLGAMLVSNALLATRPLYTALLAGQAVFYALGAAGAAAGGRGGRALALPHYFCTVNAAAVVGFAKGALNLQPVRWKKVDRTVAPSATPGAAVA